MQKFICFILVFSGIMYSQSTFGTLIGTVTNENGEPLAFANIVLLENNTSTVTDNFGKFNIAAPQGEYTIQITFIGFQKLSLKVKFERNASIMKRYVLQSTSFEIGTMVVVADNNFIPIAPETKTTVTSAEIEHIQASSLNDVMKLTPGVETTNPTLNNVEKAQIRGGDALGTQIILDGIPLTNNANMQIGIGQSTANSGFDLRAIPAENVKEVEIIRGIPSVQYGDFTDGLLIVKTSTKAETPKAKLKYNPQLYEMNVSSGFVFENWICNANLNVASSERDIRIAGDGYTRLAAQISFERSTDEFTVKNLFYVTRAFDESKEKPGYALREAWYNRDINVKYTGDYIKTFDAFNELNAKLSVSFTKQNSYSQQLVSRDNIVISDRVTEGTQVGRIVFGSYLGKKFIHGDVWNFFSFLKYQGHFFTGDFLHSFLSGITYRNDLNRGEGIVFDPLYPPSVSVTTPRLRSYNQIPSYPILNFYAEDKVTGTLGIPFLLQIGFRYEAYRPVGLHLKGLFEKSDFISSSNGSYLNPRINLSLNLTRDSQVRIGYGQTSKSPPMGMIFAQNKYYDIIDTVSVVNPQFPDSNFALVSTFIRQQANPSIKGYMQKKFELSFDQQFDDWGFSITGFSNRTEGMFLSYSEPTLYYKRSFSQWPDETMQNKTRTYLDTYAYYGNNGWLNVNGVEATLSTKKIPEINTVVRIDAAYTYSEDGTSTPYYFSISRFVAALNAEVMPLYTTVENYSKDLLINYRFEIQAKSLGIWFTLHLQQKIIEISGRRKYDDTLAVGYFSANDRIVLIPVNLRTSSLYEGIRRSIQPYDLAEENKPNKWLFNVKVSKSLWKGAAVSFYVNNFLNNRPLYKSQRSSPLSPIYERRNPEIFYGIDLSTTLSFL